MMTARNVVIPALAMAEPRSVKAFLVFSNLVPEYGMLDLNISHNKNIFLQQWRKRERGEHCSPHRGRWRG